MCGETRCGAAVTLSDRGSPVSPFRETGSGVLVEVRAQAGAKRNGVVGEREGALRVCVTTAPERGKANEAISRVLAEFLGVS
jgi:uncharacterized protein YggU (UPF0235/DUF167 family)